MATPNKNGNGAKEVTPATNDKTAVTTPAVETKKTVEQPTEPKAEPKAPRTLEELRKYFDGLHRLVTMRERYEEHKEALENIVVTDKEEAQFEVTAYHGMGITITDSKNNTYEIKHPYLVKLTCEFLAAHFTQKVAECEDKILHYGN